MSIFFGGEKVEAVLFSPLEGRITFGGKPASNATIRLWLAWKDKKGETHEYQADEEGYFSIPKKTVVYKDNPLVQISIGQKITVEYEGNTYLIWNAGKTSTDVYGELGGKPEGVVCDLTKEELDPHLDYALLETRCEWKTLNKEFRNE